MERLTELQHGNYLDISIFTQPDPDWDKDILQGDTQSVHLYHTTFWANRLAAVLGAQPLYFSVTKNHEPLLRMVGLWEPLKIRRADGGVNKRNLLDKLILRKNGKFFWTGQPIAFNGPDTSAYKSLAYSIDNYLSRNKLTLSGGDWPLEMRENLPDTWRVNQWASLKVDITPELNTIFKNCKSSARKAVRRAETDGITVYRINHLDEFTAYYEFVQESLKARGIKLAEFKEGVNSLWHYLRTQGIYETFIASHNNEIIAGLSVCGYGPSFTEMAAFQSESSRRAKLYGPDLIRWKIIEWAKAQGLTSYDLAGINPVPLNNKEKNIRQFKEKWGGTYFEYLTITG